MQRSTEVALREIRGSGRTIEQQIKACERLRDDVERAVRWETNAEKRARWAEDLRTVQDAVNSLHNLRAFREGQA